MIYEYSINTKKSKVRVNCETVKSRKLLGLGRGRCTSGIGKLLNVAENSMHMTMDRVWLLFGIFCIRVALPHADGMD